MKKAIKIASLGLIVVVIALSVNYIYIFNCRKNINSSIESVAIVENPENNESIANYINTTIEDNYFWLDNKAYKNLSSEEKSMVYDLKKFNVYKLDITFVNKTSLYATCFTANYCRKDTYMMVPTIFGYTNVAEGYKETYSYYVFVSKNFSLTDIQDYLEKNGIDFYVIFERKLSGGSFKIKSYFDADNG